MGGNVAYEPHADTCDPEGIECIQTEQLATHRTHTAVLYLHNEESGDFEGAEFFWTPLAESPPSQWVRVKPEAGRMVMFTTGAENIHGITPIKGGARCALTLWL